MPSTNPHVTICSEMMGKNEHLNIPNKHYQIMLQHLKEEYPLEGCGLMAVKDGVVTAVYPIDNILKSPTAYEMEPLQQVQTILKIEANEEALMAIYHSHPHGPSQPSATDIAQAYYPDSIYIIVSLDNKDMPTVNAFNIVDGLVSELKVSIR